MAFESALGCFTWTWTRHRPEVAQRGGWSCRERYDICSSIMLSGSCRVAKRLILIVLIEQIAVNGEDMLFGFLLSVLHRATIGWQQDGS